MKNFIKPVLTASICIFFIINLNAQQSIREGIFTVGNNAYEITKASNSPIYFIWNMDRSELKPNREIVDGIPLAIANTKMTNKEELQKAACEAFGKEKRKQLAAGKEEISGWIHYRADGTVISIMFNVADNTILTLDDLARVEETLRQGFKASLESAGNFHRYLYHVRFNYEWDFGK